MPQLPDGDAVPTAGPLADLGRRLAPAMPADGAAHLPPAMPADGAAHLPSASSADGAAHHPSVPFGLYVHVPFCRVRCGYCDFNTYTSAELGGGADQARYVTTGLTEIRRAAAHLRDAGVPDRQLSTVFFGGGTPTILPAAHLAELLEGARAEWGIDHGAEITTEANPDTVNDQYLAVLAAVGFTRVSIGMQSAVPHVLQTLERTHTPANVPVAVAAAKGAGLDVSVDLIYGTPWESLDDWKRSVDAALAMEPDHISAYALGIEPGTKMGAQLRRGLIPPTEPDDQAAKYEYADAAFAAAGYPWYEISNWAHPGNECRHNLAYWRGADWWGIGPGAHSHVSGVRFWNVKHPRAYAERLAAGEWPAVGREVLSDSEREFERIMLEVRLREGLDLATLPSARRPVRARELEDGVVGMIDEGWVEPDAARNGRVILTLRGRLMADAVTRELTASG
ncbi:MAG TPA: radical SAM family heme chaperone HemW [Actinomycetaceae bacterium]|nr:radical SAM family heme chaperone HemW [Actinomycetaceae bacterium]